MAQLFTASTESNQIIHCHLMVDLVKKLSAIKMWILKMLKMIVLRIC